MGRTTKEIQGDINAMESGAMADAISGLIQKWLTKAREHEAAMRKIEDANPNDEEWFLHREVAETFRQCAHQLRSSLINGGR